MSGRGGHRTETFTVPEGRRLVVTHIAFVTWAPEQCQVRVDIHGIQLLFVVLTTAGEAWTKDVRFTAYEREQVVTSVFGADMAYAIDGYLLQDHGGEPDDADNVIQPMATNRPLELTA